MKTDDLISQLSQDLQPVKAPEKPLLFVAKWVFFSVIVVVLAILGLHPRIDLLQSLEHFDTWLQLAGFAALLFASLYLTAWSSSPGKPGLQKYLKMIFAVLALLTVLQVLRVLGIDQAAAAEGVALLGSRCALVAMTVGAVTGAFITWKTRQGASTSPLLSGLIIGFAAVGAGGIAITLHCSSQNGMHILVWHFLLPLIVMAATGSFVGRRFLRW